MATATSSPEEGRRVIFRRYRKLPNGRILDARAYGKKAWKIVLDDDKTT